MGTFQYNSVDHDRGTENPAISVVMISYNQERYIRKAIESVLAQKTDFVYELIIADDCSKDKTRDICIDFQKQRPDIIRLILRETNLGIVQNSVQALKEARGKYVAFCEGDDFWIDPNKLQLQYDLLETNPLVTGIHTRVKYCDLNGHITGISDLVPDVAKPTDVNYLLQKNVIHTCSFMFRKIILDSTAFSVLGQSPIQDYTLFLIAALSGDVIYLPVTTAVYRKNVGVTTAWKFTDTLENHLIIFSILKKYYRMQKYRSGLYAAKHFQYHHIASASTSQKSVLLKCKCGLLSLYYGILSTLVAPKLKARNINLADTIKLLLRMRPNMLSVARRFKLYWKSFFH